MSQEERLWQREREELCMEVGLEKASLGHKRGCFFYFYIASLASYTINQ
jgi:hypothetical protein